MRKTHTKSALLTSAIALLLCFVMLLGTTFAWFTDEVTSANNKIQAGTLNIDLLFKDVSETDYNSVKELEAQGVSTAIFNYTNWEPGYVEAKNVKVTTAGTLALKYALKIVPIGEVETLADVIEVYYAPEEVAVDRTLAGLTRLGTLRDVINGAEGTLINDQLIPAAAAATLNKEADTIDYATIALKMIEEAGNEYQGKKIGTTFDINLYATQFTYENDSFDDQYDAGLEPTVKYVADAASLIDALAAGESVELMDDITLADTDMIVVPEGVTALINLDGNTITGTAHKSVGAVISNNGTLIVKDGTIKSTAANGGSAIQNTSTGTLVVENATLNGAPNADGSWPSYAVNNTGVMTVNDSLITSYHGGVASYGDGAVLTMNNTDIDMSGIPGFTSHGIYTYNNGKVIVNGGNIANNAADQNSTGASVINGYVVINSGNFTGRLENYYGTPEIKGGVFNNNPARFVAAGYKVADIGGQYAVISDNGTEAGAKDEAALNDAINAGAETIYLGSDEYNIPTSAQGKTITFKGNGETEVALVAAGYEGADFSLSGSTVVFENLVITPKAVTYNGFAGADITFNNCEINNALWLYGDSEFNNCTFNISGDAYNLWTWAAPTATFNGCTFNSDGKALLLYGGANTKLTLNDCVFNDNGGLADLKAAVEIGNDYGASYELIVNNTVVNGYEINDKGIYTGSTLWGNKNSMDQDKLNVVVDGVDVY